MFSNILNSGFKVILYTYILRYINLVIFIINMGKVQASKRKAVDSSASNSRARSDDDVRSRNVKAPKKSTSSSSSNAKSSQEYSDEEDGGISTAKPTSCASASRSKADFHRDSHDDEDEEEAEFDVNDVYGR